MNPNILVVTFIYIAVTSKIFYRDYEIDANADGFREITDCFDADDTADFLDGYVKEHTDLKDCWDILFTQSDHDSYWKNVNEYRKARRLDSYGECDEEYSTLLAY